MAAGVASALVLAGCTTSASGGSSGFFAGSTATEASAFAQANGFDWEVGVLDDGRISAGEYEQAYDRYMKCQEDLGYVFDKPKILDPVGGLQWQAISVFRGTGEPPLLQEDHPCYVKIFLIEDLYLSTSTERMDPTLLAALKACLDDKGVPYRGDEVKFADFTDGLTDAELADEDEQRVSCLIEKATELFPDLLAVNYGR